MALALPVLAAVAVGLALGGRLGNLAAIEFRAAWLFFAAIALQFVAFPLAFFPWDTSDRASSVIWVASYGLLIAAATLNRRITGVPIVAVGMLLNLAAILANRGTMPVDPAAMRAAGDTYSTSANSTAMSDPALGWLVDRWAAPDWVLLANVYSVGDVVIAIGAVVLVLAAMRAHVRGPLDRRVMAR